jgi:protein involved in polysaccharide export with SLBB domain
VVLILSAHPVIAQHDPDWDPRRAYSTRADLQASLVHLDSVANASRASDAERSQARRSAALVRARLADGDLQPGDRVLLRVEAETQLTDTFVVNEARRLLLPTIGEVPVAGVLRSELEAYLRTRLAVFIQHPVVTARPLIRLAVIGEVGRPGFYLVSPTSQLEDALMTAGGPTHDSKLSGLEIQHSNGDTWAGDGLQREISAGRTLDELGVRSGDRVYVPRHRDMARILGIVTALVTIPLAIMTIRHGF